MPAPSKTAISRKLRAIELMFKRATSRRKVSFEVKAATVRKPAVTGVARCGVAQVPITPKELVALAGYSLAGHTATGTRAPLYARALYMDDGAGHTAALCFVDLWCASLYLLHQAAAYTASSGIGVPNLILAGTHTHAGPGRYFGNTLYDLVVQNDLRGFDQTVADELAKSIATCVNDAHDAAVPASLGIATANVWGVSRNRAYPAFLENPEAASWNVSGPGAGAPGNISNVSDLAIDPRVFCLAAVTATTPPRLLGAFATFSCHATALGENNDEYDPDWPGVACNLAAQALASPAGMPVVALADSAGADITPMPCDKSHGEALVQLVGKAVSDGVVQAARQAAANAAGFTVEVHANELTPTLESTAFGCLEDKPTGLVPWAIGAPALGGAMDGHSSLYPFPVKESMVADDPFDDRNPQFPKSLGLGKIQTLLRTLFKVAPAQVLPLHILKVAGHVFATIPGEPTITTAFRLEKALKAATGAASASIIGYAGDYSGYYPTHEEYMLQRYEGASMIRGRHAAKTISDALVNLATSPAASRLPATVKFSRLAPRKK